MTVDPADEPDTDIIPLADRTSIGSLAGQLDLSGGWDDPDTNAEVAADFGVRP